MKKVKKVKRKNITKKDVKMNKNQFKRLRLI